MLRGSSTLLVLMFFVSAVRAQAPSSATSPILDRAAERAVAYEDAALQWTCDEVVRRIRYDGNGQPTRESARAYALLMVTDPDEHHAVELTFGSNSNRPGSERAPAGASGFPPATSWLRLFHPETRRWVLLRDVGGDDTTNEHGHPFSFRGAWTFDDGSDLREWEGTAWVDPETGDLLRVDATPSSQSERIPVLVDHRNKWGIPIDFFGLRFSIGPTAHGRHAEVSFGLQDGGFWLPTTARLETFDAVTKHTKRPLRAAILAFQHCRRFETESLSDERSQAGRLKTRRP
jgi:hypothetical protein